MTIYFPVSVSFAFLFFFPDCTKHPTEMHKFIFGKVSGSHENFKHGADC